MSIIKNIIRELLLGEFLKWLALAGFVALALFAILITKATRIHWEWRTRRSHLQIDIENTR